MIAGSRTLRSKRVFECGVGVFELNWTLTADLLTEICFFDPGVFGEVL